ncbi:MAG TPA: histidine kinase [Bryobacteraceae bacterium]|nr:histidine kinase [Bryobacteraceae bacterium]
MSTSPIDEMLLNFMSERESELNRVSRTLHDDVGQVLSAIGLQLDALRLDYRSQAPEIEQRTAEIQQLLETVIGRIRDLSYALNPSVVQRAGLQFALERLVGHFRDTFQGTLRGQLDPSVRIPLPQAEPLYRVTESALELATTAPGCNNVELQLKRARNQYVIEIRANARPDFDSPSRLPALFMHHYARRHDIAIEVSQVGEHDTIIRFSSKIAPPNQH